MKGFEQRQEFYRTVALRGNKCRYRIVFRTSLSRTIMAYRWFASDLHIHENIAMVCAVYHDLREKERVLWALAYNDDGRLVTEI